MIAGTRWKRVSARIVLISTVGLAAIAGVFMLLDPIPQWPGYHLFADDRSWLGIPNGLNVMSNIGFLLVGAWGVCLSLGRPGAETGAGQSRVAYLTFFAAVFLTAFGSAWYHLEPGNERLVWDRLPMAVASMALLAIAVSELVGRRVALALLLPLVVTGIGSVLWWWGTESWGEGDLRPYGLVQFLPGLLIPLMLLMFRAPTGFLPAMAALFLGYGLAKLCEFYDAAVYRSLAVVSGHSLKHLLAAAAAGGLLVLLHRRKVQGPAKGL